MSALLDLFRAFQFPVGNKSRVFRSDTEDAQCNVACTDYGGPCKAKEK